MSIKCSEFEEHYHGTGPFEAIAKVNGEGAGMFLQNCAILVLVPLIVLTPPVVFWGN
jgi:hypothetical protein